MRWIQRLGRGQRVAVFVSLMIGGVLLLVGLTALLVSFSYNNNPRITATALVEGVSVREFAALPDDDAFPAAVSVGADGTVYTGSRATGTVWAISPDGDSDGVVTEIPGTRENIGAVNGLESAPDGTLFILDRLQSDPRASGGTIWRLSGGELSTFGTIEDANGFISPGDITVDAAGRVYATDRGRNLIWQWDADSQDGRLWWVPPPDIEGVVPTGLAYEPANNAILITDSEKNTIYRVPIAESGGAGDAELIYQHDLDDTTTTPSLTGITVAPDGTVYAAALSQNGLVRIINGEMHYIVGTFRGINDVTAAPDGKLYVANFDSRALILPLMQPQLPFAIDVVSVDSEQP